MLNIFSDVLYITQFLHINQPSPWAAILLAVSQVVINAWQRMDRFKYETRHVDVADRVHINNIDETTSCFTSHSGKICYLMMPSRRLAS